jgi:hypothetical protein
MSGNWLVHGLTDIRLRAAPMDKARGYYGRNDSKHSHLWRTVSSPGRETCAFLLHSTKYAQGGGIAQSVHRQRGRSSSSGRGQEFSLLHVVYTSFGAHPASFTMGAEGSFPGDNAVRGENLTNYLQLVPRSRKGESIHPPPHKPSWRSA